MRPADILRKGIWCTALVVGACSFNVPKGSSGTGASSGLGTGGIGNFGGSSSGANSGQGGLGNAGGGMECGEVDMPSSKLPPDILIVLDRSGSMQQDPTTGQNCTTPGCSKWDQVTSAINMVLSQTDTSVNWGLKLFGSSSGCTVTNQTEVPIAAMNSMPVANRIAMTTPGSSTPTRAAVQIGTTYLMSLTDPNQKFLLVATDGSPNCPANCSGNTCMTTPNPAEEQAVVDAITTANTAGFKTFVVGVATASDPDADMTLTNMANAGGVPRAGTPPYYPVASQADLVTALGQIVTVAGSCTFQVPNPPTNDGTTSRGDIAVKGDGTIIPQDANNGWTYSNPQMTSVDLHGSACDMVKAGQISAVSIVFHCHVP
jgi:hypothetical protein